VGLFIDVILDKEKFTEKKSLRRLVEVCPVDIFRAQEDDVIVVAENEDECILCNLCVEASPPGGVDIRRRYAGARG